GASIESGSRGLDLGVNGKVWLVHKSKATSDGPTVNGDTNLEVTVDESIIDSKEFAVVGESNTKIKLTRGANVHGGRTAIKSGVNLKLTLENSTVSSEGSAVCSSYNTEIAATHSTLSGGVEALRLQRKPNEL